MLFNTSCFKNLQVTSRKVHTARMQIVRNVWPRHFFTVFSTICGTVVEENEKTQGIEIGFLGPLGPF